MADITASERKAIATSIAQALASDAPVAAAPKAGPAAAAAGNPKQFFCQNWPTIRAGLQVLETFAPIFIRPIIGIVIKAGDAASGVICA